MGSLHIPRRQGLYCEKVLILQKLAEECLGNPCKAYAGGRLCGKQDMQPFSNNASLHPWIWGRCKVEKQTHALEDEYDWSRTAQRRHSVAGALSNWTGSEISKE